MPGPTTNRNRRIVILILAVAALAYALLRAAEIVKDHRTPPPAATSTS